MILQQLIQKNKRLLRKVLKSEGKNTRHKQNSQLSSNLLQINRLSKDTFNLKNFLLNQNTHEEFNISKAGSYRINGEKYLFLRQMSNKIIKQEIVNAKMTKTHGASNQKWVKYTVAERQKRLIQTAHDFTKVKAKNKSIEKQIQNLPDSFTLKNSRLIRRARSGSMNYDIKERQNCIHSRQKYLNQQSSMKKRHKQRSYTASLQGLLIVPYDQTQPHKIQNIKFQGQKISLQNRKESNKQQNGHASNINIFQEYRKAKMKYQKDQRFQPWKKMGQRKQIDLIQLYELTY